MSVGLYASGLEKGPANFAVQSPIQFIERAAVAYPTKLAVIHGELKRSWSETYQRCKMLASALQKLGIQKSETVAVMLPNTPPMVEAHFGIAMAGAVLCALNTRQDARALAFMLEHSEASLCSSIKASARASCRVLSAQSTAPAIAIPKWASTIGGVLGSITATVSDF